MLGICFSNCWPSVLTAHKSDGVYIDKKLGFRLHIGNTGFIIALCKLKSELLLIIRKGSILCPTLGPWLWDSIRGKSESESEGQGRKSKEAPSLASHRHAKGINEECLAEGYSRAIPPKKCILVSLLILGKISPLIGPKKIGIGRNKWVPITGS